MEKYKKYIYVGIGILVYLLLAYIFLKYAFGIILPFLFSFLIVTMTRPIIDKISKHTRVPKSVVSIFVIGIMLLLFVYLLVLASGILLEQIGNIIDKISEHLSSEENYITYTLTFFERLIQRFPFLKNNISEDTSIYSVALEMATNALKNLSTSITQGVGKIIASMPEIIITIVVIILSLFYFSKDYSKVKQTMLSIFPKPIKDRIPKFKKDIFFVISSYFRSYIMILFITFAEVFAGLLILGVENAFSIGFLIALVDLLPILGVGTVLVPWACISFIGGNNKFAIGLLILFVIIYLVRQFIEPRIVSSQMNVHPLIAIFSMYAGLKIAGIGGMIVSPFLAFLAKTIYDGIKNEKNIEKEEKL